MHFFDVALFVPAIHTMALSSLCPPACHWLAHSKDGLFHGRFEQRRWPKDLSCMKSDYLSGNTQIDIVSITSFPQKANTRKALQQIPQNGAHRSQREAKMYRSSQKFVQRQYTSTRPDQRRCVSLPKRPIPNRRDTKSSTFVQHRVFLPSNHGRLHLPYSSATPRRRHHRRTPSLAPASMNFEQAAQMLLCRHQYTTPQPHFCAR